MMLGHFPALVPPEGAGSVPLTYHHTHQQDQTLPGDARSAVFLFGLVHGTSTCCTREGTEPKGVLTGAVTCARCNFSLGISIKHTVRGCQGMYMTWIPYEVRGAP